MFLLRRPPWTRTGRLAATIIISLFIIIALTIHRHLHFRDHYLEPESPLHHLISPSDIETHDWKTTCQSHGFSPFPHPRKVYDLVLFSTELDWLEIRLHTHAAYVDYFVIVESPTTFTHKPKPLLLQENWHRFKEFHHQIIHRVVEDHLTSTRHWDHEDFLRNSLLHEVFPPLQQQQQPQEKEKAASPDDVLIVSDMDELLKPATLHLLRHCDFPQRLTLNSHFYYYSFQFLHAGSAQWPHPQATTFGDSVQNTLAPNDLRMNLLPPPSNSLPKLLHLLLILPWDALSRWWNTATLHNAGWHCSSCFSTLAELRTKMNSFSHQGWNTEHNRKSQTILHRVRNGLDLFGREGENFVRIEAGEGVVPEYVLGEWEREGRFGWLVSREGEGAGFVDVEGS